MREGRWEKKRFVGTQLSGSTLGVIGLGRIGQTVAKRAVAFGMTVMAFDPYVNAETAEKLGVRLVDTLEQLLPAVDYLTLHVPENARTEHLIGRAQIASMKATACIVNCARGGVVDMDAVVEAVEQERLGGAAFDVFASEPPADYEFARHDRILATPHLGASTEAAQMAVAVQAAEQMVEALARHNYRSALNISAVPPEEMKILQPYCDLAARLGSLVTRIAVGHPRSLSVACKGEVARMDISPIVSYGTVGLMQAVFGAGVNIVSAPYLASERGIRVTSSTTVGLESGFTDLVEVTLETDAGQARAAGTVFGRKHARITQVNGFHVEIIPEGAVMVVYGNDVPGLIGKVGALLGDSGVNIARMAFGREKAGGRALLALNLDSSPGEDTVEQVKDLELVERAFVLDL
jgi:D-3-phosphoglycerate dehydrogenase